MECHLCGKKCKGNLSSPEEVAVKCSHCLNGEVEHVRKNPDKFHVINNSKKSTNNLFIRNKYSKMPRGTTLGNC